MISILSCPTCKNILNKEANSFKCSNGHTFDLSKEGYLNLLLVTQKSSNIPGDSIEMVEARRSFLEKGFYLELANTLGDLIATDAKESTLAKVSILDAGCGEGYYLGNIYKYLKDTGVIASSYGFDISKPAISLSAKKYKESFFIVSNVNYDFPFITNPFNYILNIFAPRNTKEFNRILSPTGKLIIVFPGAEHLINLRKVLGYDISYAEKQEDIINYFQEYFKVNKIIDVKSKVILDKLSAQTLIKMTPIFWKIDQSKIEDISDVEETLHFNVLILEKK